MVSIGARSLRRAARTCCLQVSEVRRRWRTFFKTAPLAVGSAALEAWPLIIPSLASKLRFNCEGDSWVRCRALRSHVHVSLVCPRPQSSCGSWVILISWTSPSFTKPQFCSSPCPEFKNIQWIHRSIAHHETCRFSSIGRLSIIA